MGDVSDIKLIRTDTFFFFLFFHKFIIIYIFTIKNWWGV